MDRVFIRRCTAFLAAGLLALATLPAAAQDADGPFQRRCGQCHTVAEPGVLVPELWLERLDSKGTMDDLTAEDQKELLSFFQHHGQDAAREVAMSQERRLFERKCSLCHNPNRVFIEPLSAERLADVVTRMRLRAPDWISESEADTILAYLQQGAPGNEGPIRQDYGDDVMALYYDRCSACHTLERVYLMLERDRENTQWALTVKRMQARAPGWISDEDADKITAYLESLEPQLAPGQLPTPVE